jgi:hypothetical protein
VYRVSPAFGAGEQVTVSTFTSIPNRQIPLYFDASHAARLVLIDLPIERTSMPIHVQFDNEQRTIMRYEFIGRWTWQEYHQAIEQGYTLSKPIPYTVNLILDFSQGNTLPHNALSIFGTSMKTPPRDFDFAVVVSQSAFIQMVVKVFQRVYREMGNKLIYVQTIKEAREVAERRQGNTVQS